MRFGKSESSIQKEIRLALAQQGIVFRTNAGVFWQGKRVYSKEFGQYVLVGLRPVQGLPEGFSDLLVVLDGRVAFVETKRPGEDARTEQERFLEVMRSRGHIAGVAHSVEEALGLVTQP